MAFSEPIPEPPSALREPAPHESFKDPAARRRRSNSDGRMVSGPGGQSPDMRRLADGHPEPVPPSKNLSGHAPSARPGIRSSGAVAPDGRRDRSGVHILFLDYGQNSGRIRDAVSGHGREGFNIRFKILQPVSL